MDILFLIGRLLFGGFYVYNGINHFINVKSMTEYSRAKGVPAPGAAVIVAGILLLIGGISILLGLAPIVGLISLIIFFIPVTFKMHDFWGVSDPMARMAQRVNFTKNIALLGAVLICFIIPRPWPWGLMK